MISATLLNSDAVLNNYITLSSIEYVPGETVILNIKLFNPQLDIRYVPDAAATMTMTFKKSDGTDLIKTATELDTDDRSMWTTTLSGTETLDLASSNIQIDLDTLNDATIIFKTVIRNGLSKILITGDC